MRYFVSVTPKPERNTEILFRMNNVVIAHGKQVENYRQKQCADELCDINGNRAKIKHCLAEHFGKKHKQMPNHTQMFA